MIYQTKTNGYSCHWGRSGRMGNICHEKKHQNSTYFISINYQFGLKFCFCLDLLYTIQMGKKTTQQKVQPIQRRQEDRFFEDGSESSSPHRQQASASATHAQPQPQLNKSKKIAKSKKDGGRQDQNEGGVEKVRNFQCMLCGKKYGSTAATHTHINDKHPEHQKNKKKIIKNLNASITPEIENNHVGIRMKDIDYPETEAGCMEISDIALYHIYEDAKKIYKCDKPNILISEDDPNFYEDIQSEEEENEKKVDDGSIREVIKREPQLTKREQEIKKFIQKQMGDFPISELAEKVKGYWEFKTFIQRKFNLQMESELMKFFKPEFAAKIKIQLRITAVFQRESNPKIKQITFPEYMPTNSKLLRKIKEWENRLWTRNEEDLKEAIKVYYHEWVALTQVKLKNMVIAQPKGSLLIDGAH